MGIRVKFNPDLALRDISEFKKGNRKEGERIPENLEVGKIYLFLKKNQRNYWLFGEIPLLQRKENGGLSRPRASIQIIEATHFLENNEMFTRVRYRVHRVVEVFKDGKIYFEGLG
jgi:hypothetical protein